MVHKKRLRRDYFLSTMQNCIQPRYSQNHFYALDQINMLKLQRNFYLSSHKNDCHQEYKRSNLKRKYFANNNDDKLVCSHSETQLDQISSLENPIISPIEQFLPKTVDYISIDKSNDELKALPISNEKSETDLSTQNKKSEHSPMILSHLEKILNLCGELRSLAKDVESHLSQYTRSKMDSPEINKRKQIEIPDSEQTIVDIDKELEIPQTINDIVETNSPLSYQLSNDVSSIHSESGKSHQLMVCLLKFNSIH